MCVTEKGGVANAVCMCFQLASDYECDKEKNVALSSLCLVRFVSCQAAYICAVCVVVLQTVTSSTCTLAAHSALLSH